MFRFLGTVILLMLIVILGLVIWILAEAVYRELKGGKRKR